MSKQLIMFIAYKTTGELVNPRPGRRNHFSRAILFITFAFAINIAEIVLVVNSLFFKKRFDFTDGKFFLIYLLVFSVYFPVAAIFKKNTFAKSIRLYKDSKLAAMAGAIGLSYFLLNLGLAVYLIFIMVKYY